jgi:hypothetical protein
MLRTAAKGLEVSRLKVEVLGHAGLEARGVTRSDLPASADRFDRETAGVGRCVLNRLATKAAWAEMNLRIWWRSHLLFHWHLTPMRRSKGTDKGG